MSDIDTKTSPAFRAFWFGLPKSVRQMLNIRSCVIGFNAAMALGDAQMQAEMDRQAGEAL